MPVTPTTHPLLGWLDEPSTTASLRLAAYGDAWDSYRYSELAALVHASAARLLDLGVGRGDLVPIVAETTIDFVAGFFGILLAGATPTPLAPAAALGDATEHAQHVAAVLRSVRPRHILASGDHHLLLREAMHGTGSPAELVDLGARWLPRADVARPPSPELAILQFTSGSRGRPRGVRVTCDNIGRNLNLIQRWVGIDGAHASSWLPLYHDMGLVGTFLAPICAQAGLSLMRPDQFVRSPLRWLRTFGSDGAECTAAPTFGWDHVRRRVRPAQLEGLDFSGWRVAIVGAERVDARVLDDCLRLLGPHGLRPSTFCPAYGLAEATLAVTGVPEHRTARVLAVELDSVTLGRQVSVQGEHRLGSLPDQVVEGATLLVGCGVPLDDDVEIIDGNRPLPEGRVGEIYASGPSITGGYHGETASGAVVGRGLRTGDSGFMLDGELYVLGRIGDSLKVRGRTVWVEDMEAAVFGHESFERTRGAVLAGSWKGTATVLVLFERDLNDQRLRLVQRLVRDLVGDAVVIRVLRVARRDLLRTSSGKPRRRVIWQRLSEGTLSAQTLGISESGLDDAEQAS